MVCFAYTTVRIPVHLRHLPTATKFKSKDHSVPVANGTTSINIRLITPTAPEDATFPVVYWLHGGGLSFVSNGGASVASDAVSCFRLHRRAH